jgi:hypothetical protein
VYLLDQLIINTNEVKECVLPLRCTLVIHPYVELLMDKAYYREDGTFRYHQHG